MKLKLLFTLSFVCFILTANAQWKQTGFPYSKTKEVHAIIANGMGIFAGTNYGEVYLSSNNGVTWSDASAGLPAGGNGYDYIIHAFIDNINGSNFFVGTDSGVFINNGISSWKASGLKAYSITSFATIGGANLFAGTKEKGVYLSIDHGLSWIAINNGLPTNINILHCPLLEQMSLLGLMEEVCFYQKTMAPLGLL